MSRIVSKLGRPLPPMSEFVAHAHEEFKHWRRSKPQDSEVSRRVAYFMRGYCLRLGFSHWVVDHCNKHRTCVDVPCSCELRYPEFDVDQLAELILVANGEKPKRELRLAHSADATTTPVAGNVATRRKRKKFPPLRLAAMDGQRTV